MEAILMIRILDLVLVFGAGVLLGIFFFVGLWWTTQKLLDSKHPIVLFFISLLLRMSIGLTGFYFVAHDSLLKIFIVLAGFILARFMVMRLCTQTASSALCLAKGAQHAS
jgi:F1F0 ATPase subunit 2